MPDRRSSPWLPEHGSHLPERRPHMVKVALFVRLEAKPGREGDVESFLRSGLPMVQEEPATIAWFGIRMGQLTFGIFEAFLVAAGGQATLSGRVAGSCMVMGTMCVAY